MYKRTSDIQRELNRGAICTILQCMLSESGTLPEEKGLCPVWKLARKVELDRIDPVRREDGGMEEEAATASGRNRLPRVGRIPNLEKTTAPQRMAKQPESHRAASPPKESVEAQKAPEPPKSVPYVPSRDKAFGRGPESARTPMTPLSGSSSGGPVKLTLDEKQKGHLAWHAAYPFKLAKGRECTICDRLGMDYRVHSSALTG